MSMLWVEQMGSAPCSTDPEGGHKHQESLSEKIILGSDLTQQIYWVKEGCKRLLLSCDGKERPNCDGRL